MYCLSSNVAGFLSVGSLIVFGGLIGGENKEELKNEPTKVNECYEECDDE